MSSDKKTMLRACCAMLPLALVAALTLVLVASLLARAGVPLPAAYAVSIVSAALGTLLISRGGRTLIALPSPAIAAWLIYEEIIARGLAWQEALGIVAVVSLLYALLFHAERETHPIDLLPPIVRTGLVLGLGFSMLVTACLYARILLPSPWALTMGGALSDPLMYYTIVGIVLTLVLHTMHVRGAVLIGMAVVGALTLLEGFWEIPAAPFLLPEGLDQTLGAFTFPMRIEAAVTVGVTLFFALMVESGASLAAVESLSERGSYRVLTRLREFRRGAPRGVPADDRAALGGASRAGGRAHRGHPVHGVCLCSAARPAAAVCAARAGDCGFPRNARRRTLLLWTDALYARSAPPAGVAGAAHMGRFPRARDLLPRELRHQSIPDGFSSRLRPARHRARRMAQDAPGNDRPRRVAALLFLG